MTPAHDEDLRELCLSIYTNIAIGSFGRERAVSALLHLCHQQQAKAWREASRQCEKGVFAWTDMNNGKADALQEFADWCESKAKEIEHDVDE